MMLKALTAVLVVAALASCVAAQPHRVAEAAMAQFSSESDALAGMDKLRFVNSRESKDLVGAAVTRGWWKMAKALVAKFNAAGINCRNSVQRATAAVLRESRDLNQLAAQAGSTKIISPAYKWAQNNASVLLLVKFSHKWDSPASVAVDSEKCEFGNKSVEFVASDQSRLKSYVLKLNLLHAIDVENSTFALTSVGRARLTLAKAKQGKLWRRLLKVKQKPSNQYTWWEMREKFESELEAMAKEARRAARARKRAKREAEAKAQGKTAARDTDDEDDFDDVELDDDTFADKDEL
eukprot:PLAT11061.1.p1 GENE.PLAT11061.1~~PLAT11061.1.p1  ORF type:complete len:294 (+),score=146.83 PLAT11061.1:19-900(+)